MYSDRVILLVSVSDLLSTYLDGKSTALADQFSFRHFLLLDEAIASRPLIVIVCSLGGRKRFWSQPDNSKMVCQWGVDRNQ